MKLKTILLFTILTAFSSCIGQNSSENESIPKNQNEAISIGDTVSDLGEKIKVIFQDKKDNYWFGGDKGVYKYDGKRLILFTKKDGLCSHDILGIQEDQFGNIFFDTSEGVSKFNGQKFKTLLIAIPEWSNSNNGWEFDSNDLVFRMGFNHNGPYLYDSGYLFQLDFPKTEQADKFYATYPNASFNPYGIYSLNKDSKGRFWFGTAALGVFRYDPSDKSKSWLYEEQMTTTPSGGAFGIRSIFEDKTGKFWFTNTRYRYDIQPGSTALNGTSHINYNKENGLGYSDESGEIDFPYFLSIAEDNNGDLWMATYDEGVWKNNGKELIHYPIFDGEKQVLLFSIYKDNYGILWLGTQNAGLYKFNGNTFEKFNTK